jgi:response regulator RpfG family c-di-GMP phosphodiesterase
MPADPPRLLIVDDEERILGALRRSLRREGYELVTARTPREALEYLERERFDAVLSDHKMPGMTGVELLAQVSRLQPHAARLLITGWSQAVSEEELETTPIDAILPKPWEDGELKDALRKALG